MGSINIWMFKDNNVGIWDEWVIFKIVEFCVLIFSERMQCLIKKIGVGFKFE